MLQFCRAREKTMSDPRKTERPDRLPDTDAENDPPADLREEWQNEDIEIAGRKPTEEEDEADTGSL
jgi:hypothetical protein